MIDVATLAWCAGLFEGEGSIRINKPTKRNSGALLCDVVNTDEAIVRVFNALWPGHFRFVRAHGNRRPFFRWRIAAGDAEGFLTAIAPYLRGEKRERAALGLAFQSQKSRRTSENRTDAYAAMQWDFYERMKALNARGISVGSQLLLVPDRPSAARTCPNAAHHRKRPNNTPA